VPLSESAKKKNEKCQREGKIIFCKFVSNVLVEIIHDVAFPFIFKIENYIYCQWKFKKVFGIYHACTLGGLLY